MKTDRREFLRRLATTPVAVAAVVALPREKVEMAETDRLMPMEAGDLPDFGGGVFVEGDCGDIQLFAGGLNYVDNGVAAVRCANGLIPRRGL